MSSSAGYARLIERHGLRCVRPRHESRLTLGSRRTSETERLVTDFYPASYDPGERDIDHLEFALRYDGVELGVLAEFFRHWEPGELIEEVRRRPTGKDVRRLWFLYEWLTGRIVPLEDLQQGNYVDLLDPARYYTRNQGRSRRHRVNINLLGSRDWCPMIRRTPALRRLEGEPWAERIAETLGRWDAETISRAVQYFYTKETKSSFSIEREEISGSRRQRFVALLRRAEDAAELDRAMLVELLRVTVDPRFFSADYRRHDIYVGETTPQREIVHYVPPRFGDVPAMMSALLELSRALVLPGGGAHGLHPVIVAALLSFSFVYIHPFEDGNGRLHRFIIHYVLSRMRLSPAGMILPVSAAIERDRLGYDAALEAFSRELMEFVEYSLDHRGEISIQGDTRDLYPFADLTVQAEALFGWVRQTIERELVEELAYLRGMDRARVSMRDIVQLPDKLEQLFIKLCAGNQYRLSKTKRSSTFSMLSDDEVARLEEAVREAFTEDAG